MSEQRIVDLLVESIKAMCDKAGIEVTSIKGGPSEEERVSHPVSVVTGVKDDAGKSKGLLIVGFSEEAATALASHISTAFGMEASADVRQEAAQTVLMEFISMIIGNATTHWQDIGYKATFVPPLLFAGESKRFTIPRNASPFAYHLETTCGAMTFHLALLEAKHKRSERSVLVVDDSQAIRALIRNILEREGYRVYEADSANQCLEVFERLSPDLVMMDLSIPGGDGMDTIRLLKEKRSDVRVVVVSSSASEELVSRAAELGTKGYIVKPFRPDEIVEAVEKALA